MSDEELIRLAAKAAGIELQRSRLDDPMCGDFLLVLRSRDDNGIGWNPLTDDGDALRLAVKLDIQIWRRRGGRVEGIHSGSVLTSPQAELLEPDPYVATRRAIVRAAAAIAQRGGA